MRPGTAVEAEPTLRGVTDTGAVIFAVAVVVGARIRMAPEWVPVALGCAVAAVLVVLVVRRPWILLIAGVLGASVLGARAEAGLDDVPERYRGEVEVVRVAENPFQGITAQVRAGPHQLQLLPPENARELILDAEPGDRFIVSGSVKPVDPRHARSRGSHVAGRLRATRISPGPSPGPLWRVVGSVRGGVRSLSRPLPESQQGLFEGFVLGDASSQTELQQADFRGSGLTHLFVASGEHVAFLLLLFTPVSTRLGLRTRWVLTIVVCLLYALVTGLQPSVLRAATMAVVATTAAGLGRPVRSWRSLAFAVTLLVLMDPFLVYSIAFGLSVGACLGIVALTRPLVGLLPGPQWLRRPFAVTIAAQIGAAPFLVAFPGGMPVAAIPANVLAVPPAGGIMVLGVPALSIAATGLAGTGLLVWAPRLLLGWVEGVARVAAALPLGYLGGALVLLAVAGLGVALLVGRGRLTMLRRTGYLVAVGALFSPVLFGATGTLDRDGPVIVRRGSTTVVVLTGSVPTDSLLRSLSVARVRDIDAVVVPHGDDADRAMIATIGHRHRVNRVLTPHRVDGTDVVQSVVTTGDRVQLGDVVMRVIATDPVLSVYAEPP